MQGASKELTPFKAKPRPKEKKKLPPLPEWGEGYSPQRKIIPNDTERATRSIPVREEPCPVEYRHIKGG